MRVLTESRTLNEALHRLPDAASAPPSLPSATNQIGTGLLLPLFSMLASFLNSTP